MTPEQIQQEAQRLYPNDDEFNKIDRDRFMDGANFALSGMQWVSVEVKPENRTYALAMYGDDINIYLYKHGVWYTHDGMDRAYPEPTHYLPLSALPGIKK